MRIIKPSHEILTPLNGVDILQHLERVGRVCYKSEDKITDISHIPFLEKIIKSGHEAMIEHFSLGVKVICDRGVTHEIVRHRLMSYAQESTRYCNYGKLGLTFILPCWFNEYDSEILLNQKYVNDLDGLLHFNKYGLSEPALEWVKIIWNAGHTYETLLLHHNWSPQQARVVLPDCLKTEIVMSSNLREWRHFFKLRTPVTAHPQMREISRPLLREFKKKIPLIFDDIHIGDEDNAA